MTDYDQMREALDASPHGVIYGRSFKWTRLDGTVSTWGGTGYRTQEQCDRETFDYAINSIGWTPPKWWQFWRWDDYPRAIPPELFPLNAQSKPETEQGEL